MMKDQARKPIGTRVFVWVGERDKQMDRETQLERLKEKQRHRGSK